MLVFGNAPWASFHEAYFETNLCDVKRHSVRRLENLNVNIPSRYLVLGGETAGNGVEYCSKWTLERVEALGEKVSNFHALNHKYLRKTGSWRPMLQYLLKPFQKKSTTNGIEGTNYQLARCSASLAARWTKTLTISRL
jgi:hypothetical protein